MLSLFLLLLSLASLRAGADAAALPKPDLIVTLRGENAAKTRLTNDRHVNSLGSDNKADFVAQDVTFENNAPRAVFRRCRFLGWQDMIRVRSGRPYFVDCHINGRTDFIYGEATAFFDRCHLPVLDQGWITAANTPRERSFGPLTPNEADGYTAARVLGGTDNGNPAATHPIKIVLAGDSFDEDRNVGGRDAESPRRRGPTFIP